MGGNGALCDKVEDGAIEKNFQFVLGLDTQAELLWQVPWEYLRDSEEFLALSGKARVVRTPKGAGSLRVEKIPQPLKILVVVSNPAGDGEFNSEAALAAIQEALDYSRRMGWVELDYLEEATFAHFRNRLSAFQPHVVHYIGHGGKNPPDATAILPPYSGKPGETYLAFADDDGEVAPLYGQALKRLLADTPSVQLLVLSGCMTGQTAYSDALAGAGTALLRENLPALVVMQYSVLVDIAIQFAKVFYEASVAGKASAPASPTCAKCWRKAAASIARIGAFPACICAHRSCNWSIPMHPNEWWKSAKRP
jgi:CHAT domain-containing protein